MYKVSEITDLQDVIDLSEILQVDRDYPSSEDNLQPLSAGIALIDCLCQLQQQMIDDLADPNQLAGYVKTYWGTISDKEMTELEEAAWSHFLVRVAEQTMAKLRLFRLSLEYMADGDGNMVLVPLREEIGSLLQMLAEGEAKCQNIGDTLIKYTADVSSELKQAVEVEEAEEQSISRFRRKDLPLPRELRD